MARTARCDTSNLCWWIGEVLSRLESPHCHPPSSDCLCANYSWCQVPVSWFLICYCCFLHFSGAATSVSHNNGWFAQSSAMLVSLVVWSMFLPVHGRRRNSTAFYARWAFLLIKTGKLTFDDDFSPWEKSWVCNDPSQPMWWQNDDARVQGLGSLLCDSRTLIDCPSGFEFFHHSLDMLKKLLGDLKILTHTERP